MPQRLLAYTLSIVALIVALGPSWKSRGESPKAPPRPKLVIMIIVDQLRNDYLDRFRPYFVAGGFNRLMSGARFNNCRYDYAITSTGPGHASIATGTYPNIHGVIENDWYDRALKRRVNCVEDADTRIVDSAEGPGEMRGRSPRLLMGTTLGDELRLASNFQSKVISVSLKDRGAVLPGGHTANAAYWYQPGTGRFVSSTYYINVLPAWVAEFNENSPVRDYCGKTWAALAETPGAEGKVFEEYKEDPSEPCPGPKFLNRFASSPFQTEIELKFAREAIQQEKLGQGPGTDLLTISLSANDFVGHHYGPYSPQVADMTLRTDRELASLFDDLDRMIGLANVWIALSGDHGVSPTPQLVRDQRLGPGRFRAEPLLESVEAGLSKRFGTEKWVELFDIPYIYLNQKAIISRHADPEKVEAEAARAAMSAPGVFAAYSRSNLLAGNVSTSPMARRALNSFNASRGGDVFIILEPFAIPTDSETEASHGSPWSYDAQVPVLLWGSAFKGGTYSEPCQPIDLVPTLAAALGLNQPSGAVGTPLSRAIAGR